MKIQNDQFYTKSDVSNDCFLILKEKFPELIEDIVLEPSAGTGSFIEAFFNNGIKKEKILAYDIEPKHPLVLKQDFLKKDFNNKKMTAIGNPPFGKRSKLAIDFFNHCARFCETIAFIVPVQFKKYGVQSRLDENFHLIYEKDLNPTSFENNGKELTVRCCFQIWTKKEGYKDFQECIFFFMEAVKEEHLEEYWKDKKIAYVLVEDKKDPSLKWELTVEKMKINGIDVLEDDEN